MTKVSPMNDECFKWASYKVIKEIKLMTINHVLNAVLKLFREIKIIIK